MEMLKFYLKRWFRIAPLYLLAIPFYYILAVIAFKINSFSITQAVGYSLPNILSNVFFVHGLYPPGNNSIVPGGWSIGCEMIFYFIFPKLLQLFKKSLWYIVIIQVLSWIAILSLLAVSKSLGFKGEGGGSSFAYYFIANQMAPFLLGILLFFLWHNNTFHKIILWGAVIAFFLITFLETKSKAWLITPLCAGVCSAFLAKKISMIKNISALVKVGRLSYSMYLSHFFFVWLIAVLYDKLNLKVESNLACFIGFIFVFILSFLTSKLTNKYLEIPFVDMGKRIVKKLPERKIVSASNLYNASNG
jgi:peptidoglycan/LPS O-acetylase OafA/YrhL